MYPYPVFLLIAIFFGMIDRMGNLNSMVFVEYVLNSRREGLDQYVGLFLSREGPFWNPENGLNMIGTRVVNVSTQRGCFWDIPNSTELIGLLLWVAHRIWYVFSSKLPKALISKFEQGNGCHFQAQIGEFGCKVRKHWRSRILNRLDTTVTWKRAYGIGKSRA